MAFTIYAMVGPPCNGKTTMLKNIDGLHIISPDSYLFMDGEYVWSPERASSAWNSAFDQLSHAVHDEEYCVWDSTLCTRQARRRLMRGCRRAVGESVELDFVACVMDIMPLDMLLERSRARKTQEVPDSTIEHMHSKITMAGVEMDEGWKDIISGNDNITSLLTRLAR